MNERIRQVIAQDAWVIYKQAVDMEKILINFFGDDFIDFEEKERNLRMLQEEELPF